MAFITSGGSGGGSSSEVIQDAVGSILTDSATIDFTYNDGANTISADVIQAGIDHGSISGLSDNDHPQYVLDAGDTMTGNLTLDNQKALILRELTANGTESVTIQAPASLAASYTLTLPSDDGAASQVLTTDGAGVLSWSTPGAGYTDEQAQDAAGTILTDSASVDFTYNDGANTITAVVLPAGVDHGGLGGLGDNDHPQYVLKGTASATQVAFWSTSSEISGENELYWDSTNNRLGVGDNGPTCRLDVVDTTGPQFKVRYSSDQYFQISVANNGTTALSNSSINSGGAPFSITADSASSGGTGGSLSLLAGAGDGAGNGGAVIVKGGASASGTIGQIQLQGSGGDVVVGGSTTASELRFLEPSGSGTNYAAFKSPALAASYTLTLPVDDGSANQVLATDGSGVLSWATPAAGTVTGSGTSGYIAYWSSASALTGESGFFYDETNNRVGLGTDTPASAFNILGTGNTFRMSADANNYFTWSVNAAGSAAFTANSTTNGGGSYVVNAAQGAGITPGGIELNAGARTTSAGAGGTVSISSGNAFGAAQGGSLSILTGNGGGGGGAGGAMMLTAGAGDGGAGGGYVTITGGVGSSTGVGGDVLLVSGAGGSVSGNSGPVRIYAGAVVSGSIGDVKLQQGGGNVVVGGGTSASELRLLEPSGSGSNYSAFKAQAQAGNVTYTLPNADGSSGQVLSTNGSGTLSWATSGGASAAGTSGQIAFFNGASSLISEASGFSWDATNNRLGIGTDAPAVPFQILNTGEQSRVGYSLTKYIKTTVGSAADTTFETVSDAGSGGSITLRCNSAAIPGNMTFEPGSATSGNNTGGNMTFGSGAGNGSGSGGALDVFAGGGGATGAGGNASLRAGTGGATSGVGGDLTLKGGISQSGSSGGVINLQTAATTSLSTRLSIAANGVVSTTSGRKIARLAKSDADYTVLVTDHYVGLTAITATRTWTLPAASSAGAGAILIFKDESGSLTGGITLIIDGNSTETIDGATTYVMNTPYECITIICNGSNWFII